MDKGAASLVDPSLVASCLVVSGLLPPPSGPPPAFLVLEPVLDMASSFQLSIDKVQARLW
jgi:hypothetical protein